MKVLFHEIKDHDLEYRFTEETPWVMEVIGALDERMDQVKRPPNWRPRSRPTSVSFTLRRVDDLIQVSGKVDTQLYLLCSLCADPFSYPVQLRFHTLFTQNETYGEAPREVHQGLLDADEVWEQDDDDADPDDENDDDEADGKHAPMNLNASDFEVTVVTEPVVLLNEVLNEQIVLTLPMQPKPPCNEAGDCNKCGRQAKSFELPAQENLPKENPFAVLKNLKIKAPKQ